MRRCAKRLPSFGLIVLSALGVSALAACSSNTGSAFGGRAPEDVDGGAGALLHVGAGGASASTGSAANAGGAPEKGDAAGAETNLKLAYDRRANVLSGETFFDARTDDSFQKLMQRRDFRDFANKLYSQQ